MSRMHQKSQNNQLLSETKEEQLDQGKDAEKVANNYRQIGLKTRVNPT